MKLPVYSRADFSRNLVPVVASFLTAGPTGAAAREFHTADTESNDHPIARAPGGADRGGLAIAVQRFQSISAEPADAFVFAGHATARIRGKNDRRSFLTTDQYNCAGRRITEAMMSPEVPITSHQARNGVSAASREICRSAAKRGIDAKAPHQGASAKPIRRVYIERVYKVE